MLEEAARIQMIAEAAGECSPEFPEADIQKLQNDISRPDQFAINFGVGDRLLDESEVHQIAGRAGRYGMHEEGFTGVLREAEPTALGLVSDSVGVDCWRPVGLLLSGPLTVCLAVLGRYVPQVHFLDVILGDEPALEPGRRVLRIGKICAVGPRAADAQVGRRQRRRELSQFDIV